MASEGFGYFSYVTFTSSMQNVKKNIYFGSGYTNVSAASEKKRLKLP